MAKRGGFNFFGTRKQIKVMLLGRKPSESYYDKYSFTQVFGKLRRKN